MPSSSKSLREAVNQLRDPVRMRMALLLAAMAIAYLGIYSPLNGSIEDSMQTLRRSRHNRLVNDDVRLLEDQASKFAPLLAKANAKDLHQYFASGISRLNKRLAAEDPAVIRLAIDRWSVADPMRVGRYEAPVVNLTVIGPPHGLDQLMAWLDDNQRLLRVDSFSLTPSRNEGQPPSLRLKVLALQEPS